MKNIKWIIGEEICLKMRDGLQTNSSNYVWFAVHKIVWRSVFAMINQIKRYEKHK